SYGKTLEQNEINLDVKGSGWLAAFPTPSTTVKIISEDPSDSNIPEEEFELRADRDPISHDFLGRDMDYGFRISKNAASDRFTASIELAYLLADAARLDIFQGKFRYHGRQVLKGVIRDRAYPVVSVDTERSVARRELREHENALTGKDDAGPVALRSFLKSFMDLEDIYIFSLPRHGENIAIETPASYHDFCQAWARAAADEQKLQETEAASAAENVEPADNGIKLDVETLQQVEEFWNKNIASAAVGDSLEVHIKKVAFTSKTKKGSDDGDEPEG
ncbi:MAG TPA: hypothetical protein PKE16_14100, partial [Hyphomicrobium sp.]|nr:hypothetical protein [Hyphomicrobium sp.]